MTTANPQQQEVSPEREGDLHETVYRNLLLSATIMGRGEIAVPTMTVVAALLELARDLAVVSGGAWLQPDLVGRLRAVADDLEKTRDGEPAPRLALTLQETLATFRPKFKH